MGSAQNIGGLVLQVFHPKLTSNAAPLRLELWATLTPTRYLAGVFMLANQNATIPAKQPYYNLDVSCSSRASFSIRPFAFRAHAHAIAREISAWLVNASGSFLIGEKSSPRAADPFQLTRSDLLIQHNDALLARCVFNSSARNSPTAIGISGDDEMCNFYFIYYIESRHRRAPFTVCTQNSVPDLFDAIQEASPKYGDYDAKLRLTGFKYVSFDASFQLPQALLDNFGQISAVTVAPDAKSVVIFTRRKHPWEPESFDAHGHYQNKLQGPVTDAPFIRLDVNTGRVIEEFGPRDLFYLPHGLRFDPKGNLWATDVALHQVFKFTPDDKYTKPALTLGVNFTSGSDRKHFCHPTDVVVDDTDGSFFVSDGYCNNRVAKFSAAGEYVSEYTSANLPFVVPHSLSIERTTRWLHVANRERAALHAFDTSGTPLYTVSLAPAFSDSQSFSYGLFSLAAAGNKVHGLLMRRGGSARTQVMRGVGFTLDRNTGRIVQLWDRVDGAKMENNADRDGLQQVHSMDMDPNGAFLMVVETTPPRVSKFLVSSCVQIRQYSLNSDTPRFWCLCVNIY